MAGFALMTVVFMLGVQLGRILVVMLSSNKILKQVKNV
jgi:hypothetical protein